MKPGCWICITKK